MRRVNTSLASREQRTATLVEPSGGTEFFHAGHDSVVYTSNAAWLVRQHRFDGGPFKIVECVAHNSRLRFERLNHTHSRIINPQRPVAWPLAF